MKLKSLGKTFVSTLAVTGIVACGGNADNKKTPGPAADAYNMAGTFEAKVVDGSDLDMTMIISNESSFSDIAVSLKRQGDFTDKEIKELRDAGMDPNLVTVHFKNTIVLGAGTSGWGPQGGDNVSSDGGETNSFNVCSEKFAYDKEFSVHYCLEGAAKRSTQEMVGQLKMIWTRNIQDKDGQVVKTSSGGSDLNFKSKMQHVLYSDLIDQGGLWNGSVTSVDKSFDPKTFGSITIGAYYGDPEKLFNVVPTLKTIKVGELTYTYHEPSSRMPIEGLKEVQFPAVKMVFLHSSGNDWKKILVTGVIRSTGNFSGTITQVSTRKVRDEEIPGINEKYKDHEKPVDAYRLFETFETVLGTFQYQKGGN